MSYYVISSYKNELRFLLGIAGINIDILVNDYKGKLYIYQLWKHHLELKRFLEDKKFEDDKQAYIEYAKIWNESIEDTKHFRELYLPKGDKEYFKPFDIEKIRVLKNE